MDGTFGMSSWWRDHADHHTRMLVWLEGTFGDSRDTNGQDEPLPYNAPPTGMLVDVRDHPGRSPRGHNVMNSTSAPGPVHRADRSVGTEDRNVRCMDGAAPTRESWRPPLIALGHPPVQGMSA